MPILKRACYTLLLLVACACWNNVQAQYPFGATGLLTIPTAEMQEDGLFMSGVNYMPEYITPSAWSYDTANYFFNITLLPFFEVNYLCTVFKFSNGVINQDRALMIRLRALEEKKWWPSVVVGTRDAMSLSLDNRNPLEEVSSNRYYGGVYGVATKHFNLGEERVGLTLGYNHKTQESSYKDGVFYGLSYEPSFYTDLKLMADYNSEIMSLGGAVRLFNHFSLHAYCYDFKAFAGGVRYEIKLY